jgi:hypothetical protein
MKRYGRKHMPFGPLLVVITLLATGCALDSTYDNQQNQVMGGVYYGGYGAGYYHHDVIVTPPPPSQPPVVRPSPPAHASQLPARSLPRPAPRRR